MKIKQLLVVVSLAIFMPLAEADVGSALNDYFNSIQGNSKIERASLTTNGFTAGGYYQRGANVDLTLGSITPPSLKGGCGNIDFNMGAFSFISGDQIVAALKAIGQNSKALLFTEAIDIVSASLGGNIKAWIDQVNKWMGILKNSCQASSMLMGQVNKSIGLCQSAARYNNSLSDENTVQSTCQSYDQGLKEFNGLFGTNIGADQQAAKNALAAQIKMQGGILQNMLADYFNSTGRSNEMQSELGNIVISTVGDVYTQPTDKNNDNTKSQSLPMAIKPTFSISDLLSYTVQDASTQSTDNNKKVYDCDFTWDKDNFRVKNMCFNQATDSYKTSSAKSVGGVQILIANKINKIHSALISGGEITDSDLTVLSLAEAPVFQLMQAGVDVGLDSVTMPIVNKWMDYTIHRIYFRLFSDINASVKTQIATLEMSGTPEQNSTLRSLQGAIQGAQDQISAQTDKDLKTNSLDPNDVLRTLLTIRQQIMAQVSPGLQQQLSFTSTILKAN